MKLNAPKKITFLIAVILAILSLIGVLVTVPFLSCAAFWVLCAGFVLLALGCFVKGL